MVVVVVAVVVGLVGGVVCVVVGVVVVWLWLSVPCSYWSVCRHRIGLPSLWVPGWVAVVVVVVGTIVAVSVVAVVAAAVAGQIVAGIVGYWCWTSYQMGCLGQASVGASSGGGSWLGLVPKIGCPARDLER